jgi:murein L,D-transpeptidase YcbB/YkuD
VLRARLARGAIGEHEPELAAAPDPNMFGPHLERAVREFQARHGLTVDGFVGARTLAALNVTAEHRVQQLRINLERIRWVFRDIEDELLVVNIAAFHAAYIRRGEILWRARAVVGRPYRQTPIFKAGMTHIIANPTWTIPPTILREDILPAMAKDPAYLGRKHLRIYDRGGAEVAAESIDWTRTRSGGFPYVLRQGPGPGNALGRIKFMFPNPHFVYLHDTPSRALFERAERTFSSGCIRVERPFELASLLLDSDPDWVPAKVLESGRTRRFNLDHDVTVMLLYLTAFADENGEVLFRRDIYDRDPAVMQALSGPFRFAPPRGYQGKN